MYIQKAIYRSFPHLPMRQPPRQRYLDYYQDLHRRYQLPLLYQDLQGVAAYNVEVLMDYVMTQLSLVERQRLQLLMLSHWSHEFDPNYVSLGNHLLYHYQLTCAFLEVTDQGSFCSFTAILLSMQLQHQYETSLLLSFDLTPPPCHRNAHHLMPTQIAVAGLLLQQQQLLSTCLEIVSVQIWTEEQTILRMLDEVLLQLTTFNASLSTCVIYCKRASTVYRTMVYQAQQKQIYHQLQWHYLPNTIGATDVFRFFYQFNSDSLPHSIRFVCLLEEDVESLTSGLLLFKIHRGDSC